MLTRLAHLILFVILLTPARADEGMWLPVMLEKYTLLQMQAKGFRLSAEDIYSINQASLKDAVVIFGRGCTGEVVSAKGLLLTNHHCGLEMIQRHSTATNDYLNEGFWAHTAQEELVTPDLTVTFLRQMHDVTEQVLKDVSDTLPETERQRIIDRNSAALIKQTGDTCRFKIDIKPYFHGNQYFMHLYEVFEDVRLVGTPPL
ncbi:MAG: S46 family peptidase, partial [Marinilabiliaceae bacterium]|nr:S46 family peptidase [Marinilabiliaceae bacterium]